MECWNCHADVERPDRSAVVFCTNCIVDGVPPPLLFGKYAVEGPPLGSGTFGIVYKCRDPDLDRVVAIKKLDPRVASAALVRDELRAIGRLNCPSIVNVYDADPINNYYVMEFVDGGTLEERILNDIENLRTNFASIGLQICDGLAAAHVQRICHRDVKPENVLLTRSGQVKLSDFGIARFLSTNSPGRTVVGSPYYIAPEIWNEEEYDLTVDIYSLGVLFYRVWTGRFPFEASTREGLIFKILNGAYDAPSKINSAIPSRINELILSMVTHRGNRMQSIDLVRSALAERSTLPGVSGTHLVDDYQREINQIYASRNYRRSPLLLLSHVSTNAAGLMGGLVRSDQQYGRLRAEYYFPRTFAWMCAFLSSLDWHLSSLVWFKYPRKCPYCDWAACRCDRSVRGQEADLKRAVLDRLRDQPIKAPPFPATFHALKSMFEAIYGAKNHALGLEGVCLRFSFQINSVLDAFLRIKSLEEMHEVDVLHLESAGMVAWFFGVVSMFNDGFDFDAAFAKTFPGKCYQCQQAICRCPDLDREIRLAAWRYFS